MLHNFSGDDKLLFYVVTGRMARMGCVLIIILKNIFYLKKTAQTDFTRNSKLANCHQKICVEFE